MTTNPAGQRVSDEQLAEWERRIAPDQLNAPRLAALIADLRAAREENRRLQERIEAASEYLNNVTSENSIRLLTEHPLHVDTDRVLHLLRGGGSSD